MRSRKKRIVLAPDFNPLEIMEESKSWSPERRTAMLRQLVMFRNIHRQLAMIERPNFEDDRIAELVWKTYVPNSKHDAFYRANPIGRGKWLCGGNRSGKTESGVREDVAFSIGFRPWYKRDDPAFKTPYERPTVGRIIVEDWEKAAKGNIVPKLLATIPPELLLRKKRNQTGVEHWWEIKFPFDATGGVSTIEIVTNKTDTRSLEGWRGDWVHFDEPTRKAHFTALSRGLVDTNGWFWMTLTPLEEAWILDDIVLNQDYEGNYVTIYENLYSEETGSGFLTEQGIENFAAKLSEIERRARLYGEFAHLSGRIFNDFTPNVHVYPGTFSSIQDIPHHWWRDVLVDPARRKPHAVTFVAWSPRGALYAYDGFRLGDPRLGGDFNDVIEGVPTVDELVAEIKKRCHPHYPQRFWIDSYAEERDFNSGQSLLDQLLVHFPFQKWPKVKKYPNAIEPLSRLMVPDPESGVPKFFINQQLRRIIYELERYRWDNYKGSGSELKQPKDTPVSKDDDYVDCLLAAAMLPPPNIGTDHLLPIEPEVFFDYYTFGQ